MHQHVKGASRVRPSLGFTLIEVLVSLVIVATALSAGVQASNALLRSAQRQSDMLLAQICVENELIKLRLSQQMPPLGDTGFVCAQADRQLAGTLSVFATPNPNFRRVEAHVRDGTGANAVPLFTSATLAGRI